MRPRTSLSFVAVVRKQNDGGHFCGIRVFTDLGNGLAWPYLASSLLLAAILFFVGKRNGSIGPTSFRQYVFPPEIYRHPSAILDYKYLAVDASIYLLLYMPLITGISAVVYTLTTQVLSGPGALKTSLSDRSVLTVVAILTQWLIVGDFVAFLAQGPRIAVLMYQCVEDWYDPPTVHRRTPAYTATSCRPDRKILVITILSPPPLHFNPLHFTWYFMTPEESKARRKEWKAKGNPKCTHPYLLIEENETGVLTGAHVCIVCGIRATISFIFESDER